MMALTFFVAYCFMTLVIVSCAWPWWSWTILSAVSVLVLSFFISASMSLVLWTLVLAATALVCSNSLRAWISHRVFLKMKRAMPTLSATEAEALNAGDTWLEQDVFRGAPDFKRLSSVQTTLRDDEQSFLDNETETLCSMLDEWAITQAQDLPIDVWDYLKNKGFFGLVIQKEYGGKGFSARAHSDIVMKIASRSGVAAVTVMVPNSLGPGELLQHYGTQAQKDYFLPRLAKGHDIPCFALTEPEAGSDATSIQSEAVVIEQHQDGQRTLALRLTLNKRWITLAPVATLIGLAVQLKDPDGLLQGVGQEGITCLLMSREVDGLTIGPRHLPAQQPFMNGIVRGEQVIVPIENIIGGPKQAGHGWQMLVECLSIGRSISLPALSAASSGVAYLTTGAYARVRRQFNVEIGQFEGVMEKLAEIAGLNYLINATRLLTLAAVDDQKKPSVASAIAKYFNTELARTVINAAMDVHGGRAVVVGPRNYLSNFYQGLPIAITVEGANIMSRNLLIFGQGAMACHPFVRQEYQAVMEDNELAFHDLFWEHVEVFTRNFAGMLSSLWTFGMWVRVPKSSLRWQYKQLVVLSRSFSFLADVALMSMGGKLKRKERLSARLADGMSYLYMAMAALRQAEGRGKADAVHARWAVTYCFYHAQKSLLAFCRNMPSKPLGWLLRCLVFPFGQTMRYPRDRLDVELATLMMQNNDYRQRLSEALYLSGDPTQPIDRVEIAFQGMLESASLYAKIVDLKPLKLTLAGLEQKLIEKVAAGVLTSAEMQTLLDVEHARWDAVQVDEFPFELFRNHE